MIVFLKCLPTWNSILDRLLSYGVGFVGVSAAWLFFNEHFGD